MSRRFPQADEYVAAMQAPATSFADPDLTTARVERDKLGLPRPFSGAFTVTFKLKVASGSVAVRCYTREVPHLEERWAAIARFTSHLSDGPLVVARFLEKGIVINGEWFPVVIMPWIDGKSLDAFIAEKRSAPDDLKQLAAQFVGTADYLERLGVAHGDLQAGNIILTRAGPCLIDYDSFYLSELLGLGPADAGHPDFQHPKRSPDAYCAGIDRFPWIVIYMTLRALACSPALWDEFHTGDNLLFGRRDFADTDASILIAKLRAIPELRDCVDKLINTTRGPVEQTPTLREFITMSSGGAGLGFAIRASTGPEAASFPRIARFPGLVDLVQVGDVVSFLVKSDSDSVPASQIEIRGTIYAPPAIDRVPWLLPRADEVMRYVREFGALPAEVSGRRIFEAVGAYLKAAVDAPDEGTYDLAVAWVIHTYFSETANYSPMLWLPGGHDRGKSRFGAAMIYAAHRGVWIERLNDAFLIRAAHDLGASLFIDVKDLSRSAERSGCTDALLLRFQRGAKVARVHTPAAGALNDTVYYTVFGPTVVATNTDVDEILTSRTIPIRMDPSERIFDDDVVPERGLSVREQLVAFRAIMLGQPLPVCPKPARGRLGDIFRPLLQIIRLVAPDREAGLLDLLRLTSQERAAATPRSAETELEGTITAAIASLQPEVVNGVLGVLEITNSVNAGRPTGLRLTYQRVGRMLDRMGFQKATIANGRSAIVWDAQVLERLLLLHGSARGLRQ